MTENQTEEPFLNWIIQNQEAIKNGSAVYEGERVTPASEGVRFETCISCLIMTMRKKTPMLLVGSAKAKRSQWTATLISLLVGWWGVPFGIFFTPVVVANNLWGGSKTKVGRILATADGSDTSETSTTGNAGKAMVIFIFGVFGAIMILGLILKLYAIIKHAMQ